MIQPYKDRTPLTERIALVRSVLDPRFAHSKSRGTPVVAFSVVNRWIIEDLTDGILREWPGRACVEQAFRQSAEAAGYEIKWAPNLVAARPGFLP
jgi:hypothetical protein